jgi:hypothetical protein
VLRRAELPLEDVDRQVLAAEQAGHAVPDALGARTRIHGRHKLHDGATGPQGQRRQTATPMAEPKPEKKQAAAPAPTRILPMELKIGDRLVDETGEWEVVGRPYTTAGGKNARVRVQRVGAPAASDLTDLGRARARHRATNRRRVMATPRRSDRPGLLLWLNTAAKLRASLLTSERGMAGEEMTVRPEDTLRAAGSSTKRQEKYQRRMSSLLAGRD